MQRILLGLCTVTLLVATAVCAENEKTGEEALPGLVGNSVLVKIVDSKTGEPLPEGCLLEYVTEGDYEAKHEWGRRRVNEEGEIEIQNFAEHPRFGRPFYLGSYQYNKYPNDPNSCLIPCRDKKCYQTGSFDGYINIKKMEPAPEKSCCKL